MVHRNRFGAPEAARGQLVAIGAYRALCAADDPTPRRISGLVRCCDAAVSAQTAVHSEADRAHLVRAGHGSGGSSEADDRHRRCGDVL